MSDPQIIRGIEPALPLPRLQPDLAPPERLDPAGPLRLDPAVAAAPPDPWTLEQEMEFSIEQERGRRRRELAIVLNDAVKSDPDLVGEAQRLGIEIGVDPGVAERNLDKVRQLVRAKQLEEEDLAVRVPFLARQLRDPNFARLAHDDIDNLSTWERMKGTWEAAHLQVQRGRIGERMRMGLATDQELADMGAINRRLGELPGVDGFLTGVTQILAYQHASLTETLAGASLGGIAGAGFALAAGQAGPQVALPEELATVPTAFATGAFTGATLARMRFSYQVEAGNHYLDMLEQGLDRDAASSAAVWVGVVNSLLELGGTAAIAKGAGLGVKSIRQAFGKELAKETALALQKQTKGAALKKFLVGYATGAGGEVATEVMQEITNVLGEEYVRGESGRESQFATPEGRAAVAQRLAGIARDTMYGMAVLGLPGPVFAFRRDVQRAAAAERTAAFLERAIDNANESKVAPRNPDIWEQHIAGTLEGQSAEHTHIDGAKFDEVLKQADLTYEDLNKLQPGLADEVRQAVATGGDVVMKTATLLAKFRSTPILQALKPHLRLAADQMSYAEALKFRSTVNDLADSLAKEREVEDLANAEWRVAREAIEERVRKELTAAGLKGGLADGARIYGAMVSTLARRTGMSLEDFERRYGLAVRPAEEGGAGPTLRQEDVAEPGGMDETPRPDDNAPPRDESPGSVPAARGADPDAAAAQAAAGAVEPSRGRRARTPVAKWSAVDDAPGNYATETKLAKLHSRELGTDRVTTPAEAAQAMAYLARGAAERFDALVTDAAGKPLGIAGSFKGATANALVSPATVVAEAFRLKGAASIWLVHNHPTGNTTLSGADLKVLERFKGLFRGSAIEVRGIMAIGGGTDDVRPWSFAPSDSPGRVQEGQTQEPQRKLSVSVLERVLDRTGTLGPAVRGVWDAWHAAKSLGGGQTGLLMLNHQLEPLAWVPMDEEVAGTLRVGGRLDRIYRAISKSNASQAILAFRQSTPNEVIQNVARMLTRMEIHVPDVMLVDGSPGDSFTMHGREIDTKSGASFYSGSRGSYDPERLTAFLGKKANVTTFLHEMAHHYLSILSDIAADPSADGAAREDMQRLLDWFGVEDLDAWRAMSIQEQREAHERFAYSFERYMFKGKAPSAELRSVFQRIAAWFRRIYGLIVDHINAGYRKATGQDLPALTPEVRAVFDRMLASEEQIRHAAEIDSMAGVFESQQEAAGATDAEWQAYTALQDEALEEAIAQNTAANVRTLRWLESARARENTRLDREEKAVRQGVRAEVAAELAKEPVYRAMRWLQTGEIDGQRPTPGQGHKLSSTVFGELAPEGTKLRRLTGKNGILAKDGLHPDMVAPTFGFDSGRALVAALLAADSFDAAVDAETDARVLAERPDLADPKVRQMSISQALQNELRARVLTSELKLLERGTQPHRVTLAAAKEAARRIVGRTRVGSLDPRSHSLAEARAAKRVKEALQKGDQQAAIVAQRQRILQHELFRAAVAADDARAETIAYMERFYERDEAIAKNRDIDLAYPGRALAAAYGFGPRIERGQAAQQVTDARARLRLEYPHLAANVDALLDRQATTGGTFVDLTVDELQELSGVAESLWNEAYNAHRILVEGRRAEVAEIVGALAARIEDKGRRGAPGATAPDGRTPTAAERQSMRFWNSAALWKRMVHWARFMDGADDGPWRKYFLDPIDKAVAAYRQERDLMVAAVRNVLVPLAKDLGADWDSPIRAPELGFVFAGKRELIGALLHSGTESNLRKLLVPYGWAENPMLTDDLLDTSRWDRFLERAFAEGLITERDVNFVQFIWDTYKRQLPAQQRAHKELYGYEFATLELRPLRTPWGTLEGGYVPAYTDREAADPRLGDRQLDVLAGEESAFVYSVSTGRGHTMARNPHYMQKLQLDVTRQVAHMDQQLRFAYVQPAIRNATRLIRNHEFQGTLNGYDREALRGILTPWLEAAASQSSTKPSGNPQLDAVFTWVRRSQSLVALGFNLVNSMAQATGLANARGMVRGRFLRSGLVTLARNPRAAFQFAHERSQLMRERWDVSAERMREEVASFERVWGDVVPGLQRGLRKARQAAGRAAFLPQRVVQGMVDVMTWHGAYQQALAESRADSTVTLEEAEADAVRAADLTVVRTQGSANPEHLAAVEVTTPQAKLMLAFTSYANTVFNQVAAAGPGVVPRVRAGLWVLLVPALLESTLRVLLQGAPEDDDGDGIEDELFAHYAKGLARNAGALVPLAGPMLLGLAESEGARVQSSPGGALVAQVFRAAFAARDAAAGEEASAADVRALGVALTILSGFPVHPVTRGFGYAMDVESGKRQPDGALDYARGVLVGR